LAAFFSRWNPYRGRTFSSGTEPEPAMLRYAIVFLVLSLIAGGLGLTNFSVLFKRVSLVFFGLFFLGFLALLGFAYLLGEAFNAGARAELIAPVVLVAYWPGITFLAPSAPI
jgi:uncharacterized membrane protein YtjA (UPF0391 family)